MRSKSPRYQKERDSGEYEGTWARLWRCHDLLFEDLKLQNLRHRYRPLPGTYLWETPMTEERKYAILFCCNVVVCEETERAGVT
jgi:hypothetical protein